MRVLLSRPRTGSWVSLQSPAPQHCIPQLPAPAPPSRPACRCRAVIYFNIQVVRGQRRIIRLLKEQIANVRERRALPRAPRLPDSGCSPDGAAAADVGEPVPQRLTARSLLLQEGEDKTFLIQKLHSVYEQRERSLSRR